MNRPRADRPDPPARALSSLALISTELNAQSSLVDVTAAVLHAALELNDATVAVVATLDGAGSITRASLTRDRIPPAGSSRFDRRNNDDMRAAVQREPLVAIEDLPPGVIDGCIRSGAPSWRGDLPEDSLLGMVDQAYGHPVRDETGDVVAVLGVGWVTELSFGEEVRAVTELFCELASGGLVRARRAEELSSLAEQMRTELLPARDTRHQFDVAFDYVPALNTIGFGGDWFDIVEPEPHRIVLVVGDIAGHGVPAAAQMALAQGAVRGLSQCSPIEGIPRLATQCLTGHAAMLATLGIVEVDLTDMTVTCQLAGHPPPMLRQPDGTVLRLGGNPLPPIGMVDVVDEPGERTLVHPGSIVVLYSDGLIERRGADLGDRLDELESTIGGLAGDVSATDALETVCTGMLTDASEDDVAILVMKLREVKT